MKGLTTFLLLIISYTVLTGCGRNKYPVKIKKGMAVGTVIGKELCNADTSKDFWLIEIHSAPTIRQQYGDTVVIGGTRYVNMIKTTGIIDNLKKPGQKIFMEFNIADKVSSTTSCVVNEPLIYQLKIAEIISCGAAEF